MLDINKIHLGDSFELLKEVPDNTFDCVIADYPYGDNAPYGRNGKEILNNESVDINYKALPLLYAKMKDNSACFFFTNWKFETDIRNFIKDCLDFRVAMMICVVKRNFGMGTDFRNQHEICLVLEKGKPQYYTQNFSNVQYMEFVNHDIDEHPHKKGIALITRMIEHATKKGDLILDPTSGSGTTAKAAYKTGRNFICIELAKNYWKKSSDDLDLLMNKQMSRKDSKNPNKRLSAAFN